MIGDCGVDRRLPVTEDWTSRLTEVRCGGTHCELVKCVEDGSVETVTMNCVEDGFVETVTVNCIEEVSICPACTLRHNATMVSTWQWVPSYSLCFVAVYSFSACDDLPSQCA